MVLFGTKIRPSHPVSTTTRRRGCISEDVMILVVVDRSEPEVWNEKREEEEEEGIRR